MAMWTPKPARSAGAPLILYTGTVYCQVFSGETSVKNLSDTAQRLWSATVRHFRRTEKFKSFVGVSIRILEVDFADSDAPPQPLQYR